MKNKFVLLITFLILGLGTFAAKADTVVLTNGDSLTGTVIKIDAGKLTLHTDFMGDLVIPTTDIKTFSTDAPVEIHLADGTVYHRTIQAADPGEFALHDPEQKLPISALSALNPPPIDWKGNVRLGGTLTRGNTYTDTVAAGYDLNLKLATDDIQFTGEYNYGRQKDHTTGLSSTTVDNWSLGAKEEHSFNPRFYGYIDADANHDRIAFLALRFTPSAGLGYRFFKGPKLNLSGEGGIAWLYEDYTNGTPSRDEVAVKLAYHLTYDFNANVNLFNDLTFIPSIERASNYIVTADLGLHSKLTTKFFTELRIEWNYDSNPAFGALKNDTRYIASLGYSL